MQKYATLFSLVIATVILAGFVAYGSTRATNGIHVVVQDMGKIKGSDVYKAMYFNNGSLMEEDIIVDMGNWAVIARRDGNKWHVNVGVDFTRENAEKFLVDFNQMLAMKLFPDDNTPIYVTVIFSDPIPTDEFSQLVNRSGFRVVRYDIRGYEKDGRPVTIGGGPLGSTLIPEQKIRQFEEMSSKRGNPFVIAGIIQADGYLTLDGYETLMNSGRVRFVNVMRVFAKQIAKDYLGIDVAVEDITGPMPYVDPRKR